MHEVLKAPEAVDYTMLSTYTTCRRKYYYRIVRGLVGLRPPTAAEFGRCIHLALDSWYADKDKKKATELFKSNFIEDPEDDKRTHPVGEKILELYFTKYADQPFRVLATEQVFELPFLDTGVKFMGRIDKIIDWGGAIYVLDHKTTSGLGYTYFNKIKPNIQFDGYIWAARRTGYPSCSGVVLDALLVAKGLVTPSALARLTPLARDISPRTEAELEEFEGTFRSILADLCSSYRSGDWYMNTESCTNFVECPYRKICKEDIAIRESIIKQDYKVEHWDPRKETANGHAKPKP